MAKHRRAAKVDANQREIVEALRKIPGVSVQGGHDDILVGYRGGTYWFEIKSPSARSQRTGEILQSAKKPGQVNLEAEWAGHYEIVTSISDILATLKIGGLK